MAFMFRKAARPPTESKRSGGWYADPYGAAARRWYDSVDGWTDRVEATDLEPDKTGVARVDAANASVNARTEPSTIDGTPTAMPGAGVEFPRQ